MLWRVIIRFLWHDVSHWITVTSYEPCHEKTCLCHMLTTKVQISLRICAVWSAPLFSLPKYNISSFYILNFKPLASFCGCAGRFESYLVENPEDRFSCDKAHMIKYSLDRILSKIAYCPYMPYLTLWDKISQNLARLEANSHKILQISQNFQTILQHILWRNEHISHFVVFISRFIH